MFFGSIQPADLVRVFVLESRTWNMAEGIHDWLKGLEDKAEYNIQKVSFSGLMV